MQPKISVIVPVYKAEKYLHRCIDSILTQTFTDFELLLINDGSPDNCGAICDEYATKDSRIRGFHKENGGINSARKEGFIHCSGKYLVFLDSDDALTNEAYNTLFNTNTPNFTTAEEENDWWAYYNEFAEHQLEEHFSSSYTDKLEEFRTKCFCCQQN